jgi:ribosomal protein L11 methyltransferase
MLGAREAWAVDIDEQALEATKANSAQNGVSEQIHVGQPNIVGNFKADILLANILYKPLMELVEHLAACVRPGGSLVLSGILEEQVDQLCVSYNTYFEFAPTQAQDGWARLSAVRR